MSFSAAKEDLFQGIFQWRIWLLLGWQDIKWRYRRSYLGPLWITISMLITIYSMGFLYGHLFNMNLNKYLPHLACGLLAWTLIATLITDSSAAFMESSNYLKQIKLYYTAFIMRVLTRNIIIFMHNLIAVVTVIFYTHIAINFNMLLFIPGLLIIMTAGLAFGMICALAGTRFRDVNPIIASLIQVFFFLTPVIWSIDSLPLKYHFITTWNPFAQYISLIRNPLMGHPPTLYAYIVTSSIALLGLLIMLLLLKRVRNKIIFWL